MTSLSLQTANSTPFNTAINTANNIVKMTSQEIADLVQSRHDNVKRTVERLAESGVIQLPPTEGVKNHLGQVVANYVFEGDQGERDTTIIVAQLSPQFLGQVVDQWRFLKQQVLEMNKPSYMIEDRVERAKKWIEEETAKQAIEIKLIEAKQVIEVIQPKADVYDIISNSSNTYTIRDTAKLLKMRPKDLTDWLQANGWIYGKSSASYRPFAAHDRNHLKLVASNYGTQVRVTGKGLVWLARKLKVELDSSDFE
ncbi:phage antirepressor KilAC domain-containing protein [Acinetobacter baumannii]|uniref:phage antirepressor KilAC domain-containing protein n=1 Tax=Acinetobacter baumannii TaxID=470 RepID=UPI000DE7185F|nr:phage antirepressor KilAC domain-containing protein [Acinetobacter baumannii]MDH2580096.1 phage antirepressor KilAC domain-containing protein [Acinetobacter baumannii]SSR05489.1 DNA-binding protein (Roi) [Acinetobacter baumannii]HEN9513091.1 phage antirepressor KilAC domain-containing protein [Acinetobacter baumannii]